jgi:hypothetical protein
MEIKGMVQEFYENFFSSEPIVSRDAILDSIPSKLTHEMNDDVLKPYTNDEIKTALFQMGPTKAPGLMAFRCSSIRLTRTSSRRRFAEQFGCSWKVDYCLRGFVILLLS